MNNGKILTIKYEFFYLFHDQRKSKILDVPFYENPEEYFKDLYKKYYGFKFIGYSKVK